jgi:hypothetical protein
LITLSRLGNSFFLLAALLLNAFASANRVSIPFFSASSALIVALSSRLSTSYSSLIHLFFISPISSLVDRLAVSVPVGGQLLHDKRDAIGALWDKAWRELEDTENVYIDRMRLMRVARGSRRHSSLQEKAWRIFNQITTGTFSVDTLRWRLRGKEHVWVCPECNDVDS